MKCLMITILMTMGIFFFNSNSACSQSKVQEGPGGPIDPDVPVSDGIIWLMVAGVVFGVRKCMLAKTK